MGPKLTQAEGFVLGVGAKMFSCCGARRMSLATVRLRPSPTPAHAYAPTTAPSNAEIPNAELRGVEGAAPYNRTSVRGCRGWRPRQPAITAPSIFCRYMASPFDIFA